MRRWVKMSVVAVRVTLSVPCRPSDQDAVLRGFHSVRCQYLTAWRSLNQLFLILSLYYFINLLILEKKGGGLAVGHGSWLH
jgi:hypothetical protein